MLDSKDWDNVYGYDKVDDQWREIITFIQEAADKLCPLRDHAFKKESPPYMSGSMTEQMAERGYFYKKKSKENWK